MKRIVITGAESTGKTTLTQALSGYYGEPWTSEYVREYVSRIDRELTESDLDEIARGQLSLEDKGAEQAQHLILHDTNLLSSIIYANHYFGTVLDWVNESFLQRKYDLYLLCMPDIPWVADQGQRESPEARAELQEIFKEALERLNLPCIEISGDQVERMNAAVSAVDALLSTSN